MAVRRGGENIIQNSHLASSKKQAASDGTGDGPRKAWVASEIDKWIAQRIAARDGEPI